MPHMVHCGSVILEVWLLHQSRLSRMYNKLPLHYIMPMSKSLCIATSSRRTCCLDAIRKCYSAILVLRWPHATRSRRVEMQLVALPPIWPRNNCVEEHVQPVIS